MIGAIIEKALKGIAVVVPDFNAGCEEISIAYQFNTWGDAFADDGPVVEQYSVLVHLNAPVGVDLTKEKKAIKKALFQAGFTYPACINAGDEDMQHYVFECEYAEGLEGL